MKPTGAGSVMAQHAPAEVAADDARTALYRKLEYFPTPPWAARAGGELIRALDPAADWVWEPACGEGHATHGLRDHFGQVYATDIHDFGGPYQRGPALDFLSPEADRIDQADWIVTNPPFSKGVDFVEAGLRRARRGVAVLARSGWLDTQGRYPFFFGRATPCDLELPFFDRVPMSLGRWEPRSTEKGGSSATPYSWFVWFQPVARPRWVRQAQAVLRAHLPLRLPGAAAPIAGMASHAIVTIGIPPGTKARLTRPEDARDWGAKAVGPDLLKQGEEG